MDESSPVVLDYSTQRPSRKPVLLAHVATAFCLAVVWAVVSAVSVFMAPRQVGVWADIARASGRSPPAIVVETLHLGNWVERGGGLVIAGLAIAVIGVGLWIDRRAATNRAISIYAAIVCLLALLLCIALLLCVLLGDAVTMTAADSLIRTPVPVATTQPTR
jgi:hypothetical protein